MADPTFSTLPVRCLQCGASVAQVTRMRREYCSDECKAERKRKLRRERPSPHCAICGEGFERRSNRQKVCTECRGEKTKRYTRGYNALNAEVVQVKRRASMRARRIAHPEAVREKDRRWRERNREEISARRKTEEARGRAAAYIRARYASNPSFAVHRRMAASVWQALRDKKSGRKWEQLVGYSLSELMAHIERQFERGMSWDRMGEWHIDHIIPKSSFRYDCESDPEFRACWALTNLRPLWRKDNLKKQAKRLFLI